MQILIVDVGVDLGGSQVDMPQRFLHGDDVLGLGVEDGGEGMSQDMRGNGFIDVGFSRPFQESECELSVVNSFPPLADEEGVGIGFDS